MVVVYTVPSTKYKMQPGAGTPLDEIEIEGPLPASQPANSNATAQFTLQVKTADLTQVKASITLTRFQSIAGVAANIAPVNGIWTFQALPINAPYEARWEMVPGNKLDVNTSRTFAVQFNMGYQPGTFRLTYRVEAYELNAPVETNFDVTVP